MNQNEITALAAELGKEIHHTFSGQMGFVLILAEAQLDNPSVMGAAMNTNIRPEMVEMILNRAVEAHKAEQLEGTTDVSS